MDPHQSSHHTGASKLRCTKRERIATHNWQVAECGELWRGVAECGEVWQVVRGGKVCIVYLLKNEKNRSVVCIYRQVGTYQQVPTGTKRSVNGFHRVLQRAHDDRLSKKRIPWYYHFFVWADPFFRNYTMVYVKPITADKNRCRSVLLLFYIQCHPSS